VAGVRLREPTLLTTVQVARTLSGAGYDALFPSSEDFAQEIQQKLNPAFGNQQPFARRWRFSPGTISSRGWRQSGLPPGAVMLQLDPSVICVHTIVPLSKAGLRFATLLDTDPYLQSLAEQGYGFADSAGRQPPGHYVSPPSPQVLEAMIGAVEPGS
jgi:hypothetical protein